MNKWQFLTSYGLVLHYISQNPKHTVRQMSRFLGYTERTVIKVIDGLVESGYVVKNKSGRVNYYSTNSELTLRHPTKNDIPVKNLLQSLDNESERLAY